MFGRKRLEELEQRVTELEEIQKSIVKDYEAFTAGDISINTFEYGQMPLKEAIRKLAKFAKKEEEAEKRRMLEVAEKNFEDTREYITLEVSVDPETAHKAIEEYKRRIKEAQERKKERR